VKSGFIIPSIAASALVTSCSPAPQSGVIGSPDPRPPAGTFRIADEYEQSSNIVDCFMYGNDITTIELVNTRPVHVTLTGDATQLNMIVFGGARFQWAQSDLSDGQLSIRLCESRTERRHFHDHRHGDCRH
jgi:hypothetical protein